MITFVKLVCPSCGANLEVDSKLSQCFCQYCGTKILICNENEYTYNVNINQTNRFVDEAGLAEQETERMRIGLEKDKLEMESAEKNRTVGMAVWGLFLFGMFYAVLCCVIAFSQAFNDESIEAIAMAILTAVGTGMILYGFLPFVNLIKLKKALGVLLIFIGVVLLVLTMCYFGI